MTTIDHVLMKQELLDVAETEEQRQKIYAWLCRYLRQVTLQVESPREEFLTGDPHTTARKIRSQMAMDLLEADRYFTFDTDVIQIPSKSGKFFEPKVMRHTMRLNLVAQAPMSLAVGAIL